MIWAEHTARMRETRNVHKVLVENIKGWAYLEDLGIDCKIILEWILEEKVEICGLDSFETSGVLLWTR
jgi:hypothetical protein